MIHRAACSDERVRASEAPAATEHDFAERAARAEGAVVCVDERLIIRVFDPAAERMFGCPAEQAVGVPLRELVPELRSARDLEVLLDRRDAGALPVIRAAVRADGAEFVAEVAAAASGAAGAHVALVLRDVTVRREREREGLVRQMLRAVALRDEVLAVVSHDLRNPLNVIDLTVDTLLRHWPPTAEALDAVRRQLEVTARSTTRMKRQLRDLLDVAQIERGTLAMDLVPCDLAAIAREAAAVHEPVARQGGVRLETDLEAGVHPVRADADRILQVLGNLLENALRHTPPDGAIRLRIRREGAAVRLEVVDDGPGVPPADRERIFDRFSRGRAGAKIGAGLGLAIARGIVEAHGGSIGVEGRTAGSGAVFYFTLPATRVR